MRGKNETTLRRPLASATSTPPHAPTPRKGVGVALPTFACHPLFVPFGLRDMGDGKVAALAVAHGMVSRGFIPWALFWGRGVVPGLGGAFGIGVPIYHRRAALLACVSRSGGYKT